MTTHAELVAAVEKIRERPRLDIEDAHLEVLAAILNLHTEDIITTGGEYYASQCDHCGAASDWPCETVGIVADALRKMGRWAMAKPSGGLSVE